MASAISQVQQKVVHRFHNPSSNRIGNVQGSRQRSAFVA
jgi:hypothetical protein